MIIKRCRKNLTAAIKDSGKTRAEIHALTGLNLNTISGLASGANNPTSEQVAALSKMFKKTGEYLFEMEA